VSEPTVRLLDYGVGNIHSLTKALERSGLAVNLVASTEGPGDADGLVLPGVGAFGPAAASIDQARGAIREALDDGLPMLGVCLGMQLLAEGSSEGPGQGLGLIEGDVRPLEGPRLPHIGWNTLGVDPDDPLAELDGRHVYYVHSFVLPDNPHTIATTDYDETFPAIVRTDNVLATQFHPEKSSGAGRVVLDEFQSMVEASR
jgi:glutamine amidotransferase